MSTNRPVALDYHLIAGNQETLIPVPATASDETVKLGTVTSGPVPGGSDQLAHAEESPQEPAEELVTEDLVTEVLVTDAGAFAPEALHLSAQDLSMAHILLLDAHEVAGEGQLTEVYGTEEHAVFLDQDSPIQILAQVQDPMAGDPSSDLIFLDFQSFAKPENPGNGNGGGGGGNDSGGGGLGEYLSGDDAIADSAEYNILIDFKGSWTADLQGAFTWAADWISETITGDVADVFFRGKVIDDLRITAELVDIDGTGGILGQAGPTAVRTAGYLPAMGIMEFDIADAENFNSMGLWDDIIVHEMLHTVGFGTIWSYLGLVSGSGTSTPTFNGTEASLAYGDLLQSNDPIAVPLEEGGGSGTRESHWDEQTFLNEIMTGYINGSNYMSDITVASLGDLGYETVDWSTVTEFTV